MHDVQINPNLVPEIAFSNECLHILQNVAQDIHNVFDLVAPRRTGRMVASTHQETTLTPDGWEIDLVVDTRYARFVEHGTRYMRAQRNLDYALRTVAEGQ